MRSIGIGLAALIALLAALLHFLAGDACGHGDMDWVMRQQLKNKAGEWCCGRGDCEPIKAEDVKAVDGGY